MIDLRRPHEVDRDGRVPAYEGLEYRHLHPVHAEWDLTPYDERLGVARYLADRYLDMTETGAAGIAAALGVIADADNAPVVVHCVAGKDRTGVVCALTLELLGVDEADIATDYALSNAGSERFTAWLRERDPVAPMPWQPFFSAPAEAIRIFLAGIRQRHGSVQGYLTEAGLTPTDLAALRAHLLD